MFAYVDDIVKKVMSGEPYKIDFDEVYSKFGVEMDYGMEEMWPLESPIYFLEPRCITNQSGEEEIINHELMFTLCRAKKRHNFKHLGCKSWSGFCPVIVEPKCQTPMTIVDRDLLDKMEAAHRDNDIRSAEKIKEEWGITHAQTDEGLMFYVDKNDYLTRVEQAERLSKQQQ